MKSSGLREFKGSKGLGDLIHEALDKVGVTKEKVEDWLGHPCHCQERQDRLNRLGNWIRRVLSGKTDKAKDYLEEIINEESR